jgi:hypothetical protein
VTISRGNSTWFRKPKTIFAYRRRVSQCRIYDRCIALQIDAIEAGKRPK